MQLLIRRAARELDPASAGSEVVLAAGPDTRARAPWQWEVTLTATVSGHQEVVARTVPELLAVQSRLEIVSTLTLERPTTQLWVALVESGRLRQGGFTVDAGDVLVWEGDDPTRLVLDAVGGPARVVLVTLGRLDGSELRWVP